MQPFFRPFIGYQVLLPATSISTNISLSSFGTTDNRGWSALQVFNQSTVDAYLNITGSSLTTQSSFSTGPFPSGNFGLPVPHGTVQVYPIPPKCCVSALTTAATLVASLLLTPGTVG